MTDLIFRQLFDPESSTYTYLLADAESREALLIDPVRDQLERDMALLAELGLRLAYTLETHVHADHVTSSGVLRQLLGSKSVLSRHAGTECSDVSVAQGDEIRIGKYRLWVLETPGHTDSCVSYYDPAGQRVFTGDALLVRGCGRTDFQQGNPRKLYTSITQQLFTLPGETFVYPGHDYKGRTVSTIAEERAHNPRLSKKSEEEFVAIMQNLRLDPPKHIAEAVPANLACGLTPMAAEEPSRERGWAPIQRVLGVPEVTVDWLRLGQPGVHIVDVREPFEYTGELGHLQKSDSVPLATLRERAAAWDKDTPIVVVCRSGGRSGEAAKLLESMGFKRVASLRGGMTAWRSHERSAGNGHQL